MQPTILVPMIALSMGAVLAIVYRVQRRALYLTYEDSAGDARSLAKALGGPVSRDGDDLLIAGRYRGAPVTVRLSHTQNKPGMLIEMRTPTGFQVHLLPRN